MAQCTLAWQLAKLFVFNILPATYCSPRISRGFRSNTMIPKDHRGGGIQIVYRPFPKRERFEASPMNYRNHYNPGPLIASEEQGRFTAKASLKTPPRRFS